MERWRATAFWCWVYLTALALMFGA